MSMPTIHLLLGLAILAEVVATTALAQSNGLTRLWPALITAVGYLFAFWCLGQVLKFVPTGVVYAIWSGLGIVLIALVAWLWAGQRLDWAAVLGMGLIVAGVLVINLFSRASVH